MPTTVREALAAARAQGIDRLDAQLLLAFHLDRPRAWLIAHDDRPIAADAGARFAADVARRADGVPLAYLLGEHEFHGLRLRVTPDVLDPRPDTETLVDWALDRLAAPSMPTTPEVADLGTGSGAIALAIAHRHPAASVTATDLSPKALAVAQGNAQRLGLALQWAEGGWWAALPGRRFDLVVSNPPYIAGDDPHLVALRHEPLLALTPGGDGLDAIRTIAGGAAQALRPGGWLLLEHGWDQADAVQALLRGHGFVDVQTRADLAGRPRCTGGLRDPASRVIVPTK